MTQHTAALEALLRRGPQTAAELAVQAGISQPTVSRALADLDTRLVRIGKARSTRYALARPVGRSGHQWPLYRITEDGQPDLLGRLSCLHGGWFVQPTRPLPLYLRDEFADGLYPDLPWFLDDLRPQGYLGRAFVRRHAADLDAPADLNRWRAEDTVSALLRHGDNLPGDLILGDHALETALASAIFGKPPTPIPAALSEFHYPALATQAEAGDVVGSSAGGEQPKFTAELEQPSGERCCVIVKFARHNPDNAAARRWANLLACEHLAGQVLNEYGVAAATTRLIDQDGWRFLESQRFDRTAQRGRRGVVSLRALDAAYVGHDPGDWPGSADALARHGLIDAADAESIRKLYLFGRFIGNSDMHPGNLSFLVDADRAQAQLAPAYDMLPMHYRPGSGGEVHERPYDPPLALGDVERWRWAAGAARAFWGRAGADERIDPAFRAVALDNLGRVEIALRRFGD
ncbi:type II toxin-antitoxin system HipA family toxin YjjJ [Lysobacter enzymogenes]|uniref:Type II toxin-antitoxin system HipA family toxinoxin YjjJ n=1 Tax=Lysobacter enzymogenes TaxID=69 RepID=A0A3N2RMB3_LYSEN|nr:type II toxin-antitoxin system HipA family toxin YjjJ [Lysobacter enzymogenes]ROU08590.1 type II toxin-antitoxin system HipA family toxinoxin YjjJ [Lysobacter enzymogenes]